MPTEIEVAWAAGIFEGEGYAIVAKNNATRVGVEMSDADVIARLDSIFPAPTGIKRTNRREGKQLYKWTLYRGADIRDFYEHVFLLLGERRKGQALRVLTALDEGPGLGWRARMTHCKRGHPFSKENTYLLPTGRNCRECRRLATERHSQRAAQNG